MIPRLLRKKARYILSVTEKKALNKYYSFINIDEQLDAEEMINLHDAFRKMFPTINQTLLDDMRYTKIIKSVIGWFEINRNEAIDILREIAIITLKDGYCIYIVDGVSLEGINFPEALISMDETMFNQDEDEDESSEIEENLIYNNLDLTHYLHPHVSLEGRPCLGDFIGRITNHMLNKNYLLMLNQTSEFLFNYTEDDVYWNIEKVKTRRLEFINKYSFTPQIKALTLKDIEFSEIRYFMVQENALTAFRGRLYRDYFSKEVINQIRFEQMAKCIKAFIYDYTRYEQIFSLNKKKQDFIEQYILRYENFMDNEMFNYYEKLRLNGKINFNELLYVLTYLLKPEDFVYLNYKRTSYGSFNFNQDELNFNNETTVVYDHEKIDLLILTLKDFFNGIVNQMKSLFTFRETADILVKFEQLAQNFILNEFLNKIRRMKGKKNEIINSERLL